MICAGSGTWLDRDNPNVLLESIRRSFRFLPGSQKQEFLTEASQKAS